MKRSPGLRLAVGVQAQDQEVAVRADQHLAVALQVAPDLGRARDPADILCGPLDLHHAALGRAREQHGIAGLSDRLAGDEQAAVGHPAPRFFVVSTHVTAGESALADLVQQPLELAVVGGLLDGLAGRVDGLQAVEISAEIRHRGHRMDEPGPQHRSGSRHTSRPS